MSEPQRGKLLRIFLDEGDRHGGKPLYVVIVDALHAAGFAGATVLRGIEGFGVHKQVHASRVFDIASALPVVIETIESEERIAAFLPALQSMMTEGLVTVADVGVVRLGPPLA